MHTSDTASFRVGRALPLPRYLHVVRASAWYDLLVTWPFALPWTLVLVHGALVGAARALSTPGGLPAAPDALHTLFANLLGSVVVVWALARIAQPTLMLGRLDASARLLFAGWQVYAVSQGLNAVVLVFTVFELVFGLLQLLPVQTGTATRADATAG